MSSVNFAIPDFCSLIPVGSLGQSRRVRKRRVHSLALMTTFSLFRGPASAKHVPGESFAPLDNCLRTIVLILFSTTLVWQLKKGLESCLGWRNLARLFQWKAFMRFTHPYAIGSELPRSRLLARPKHA